MTPDTRHSCLLCGSSLQIVGQRRGQCSNASCPSGGALYQCEFCEEYSVTRQVEGLTCHNRNCRMYNTLRKGCPRCDKISLVSYKGNELCLNRRCPSNAGRFAQCLFCRRDAMLSFPDYAMCTKGHCERFLVPMGKCFFCGKTTYNLEKKFCENPECSMVSKKVELCPSCNNRSRPVTPSGVDACQNPSCAAPSKADDVGSGQSFAGTFVLGQDALQELDRIMTSSPDAAGAGSPGSMSQEKTLLDGMPTRMDQPAAPPLPPTMIESPRTQDVPMSQMPTFVPDRTQHEPPPPQNNAFAPSVPSEQETLAMPPPQGPSGSGRKSPAGFGGGAVKITNAESPADDFEPPPPAMASPVRRPGLAAPSVEGDDSPILQAYSFVKERILVDEAGNRAPVYLVIGTAGAGKTTFLSMLGEILRLRESKYYFPHEGIDVRRIQVEHFFRSGGMTMIGGVQDAQLEALRSHVRDLVFDFSQREYSGSIARMQWPEHTPPDQRNTLFLVTELTRNQKTIARIVTFETSGEDFEATLSGMTKYDPKKSTDNPVHRILYELMDMADGFIILMTPEGRANDEIYRDFFLAIRDGLEPRALNHLSSELRKRFGKADTAESQEQDGPQFTQMIKMVRLDEEMQRKKDEALQKERKDWVDYLRKMRNSLKTGSIDALDGPDAKQLRRAEKIVVELGVEHIQKARQALTERGVTKERILAYYMGLVDYIEKDLDRIMGVAVGSEGSSAAGGEISQEALDRALWEVRREYKLSDGFRLELTPDLFNKRTVRRFRNLRRIALVFTKTDMYPAVHPPENFPARNLPGCKIHLDVVENYLHLLNGMIRYYNASATGYSILRDTLYVPGPENTLTPINVIEPVFEMLGIE
jgi:hypothetical protein